MSKDRIALTGASGFIGRRILDELDRQSIAVRTISRSGAGADSALVEHAAFEFSDSEIDPQLFEGCQAVIHAAGYVPSVYGDPKFYADCFMNNAVVTARIVEAAKAAGVLRFVYLSTLGAGSIYGDGDSVADEGSLLSPHGLACGYLASKLSGEWFVQNASSSFKNGHAIFRLASVYGPGMKRGVVKTFAQRAIAGESLSVIGTGELKTDLVFVDDVARMVIAAAIGGQSGVFHLASGKPVSIREIAEVALEAAGRSKSVLQFAGAASGAMGQRQVSIRLLEETFGFVPTPLVDGMASLQNHLRS